MDNPIVTCDLSQFGYRELEMAKDLLDAYLKSEKTDFLGDGLTLNFNTHSGYVFLSDEDCNVGIEENGKIVQFFSCPDCGNEGTNDNYDFEKWEGYCSSDCFNKNP